MFANLDSNFYTLLEGGILILALYHIIIYIRYKEPVFLYYGLYFTFQFLYFYIMTSKFWREECGFDATLAYMPAFGFYILFTRELLNTKKLLPKWDHILKVYSFGIFIWLIIYCFAKLASVPSSVAILLFKILFVSLMIMSGITYVKLFKHRSTIVDLFLIGSISYFVLGVTTQILVSTVYRVTIKEYHFNPLLLSYIAVFIEALLFAYITGERYMKLRENKFILLKEKNKLILNNRTLANEKEDLLFQKSEIEEKLVILNKNANKEYLILQDKTKILIGNLMYIKSDGPYIELFTTENKPHVVRGALVKLRLELPVNFKQCHRSYIINENYITQKTSRNLTVNNVYEIPVSRKYIGGF